MRGKLEKIAIFSGAGVSAESGLKTFRDHDGLWEEYSIYEVATPEAWEQNPERVLEFYNRRRKQVIEAMPNAAHIAIAELEKHFEVSVITQNIDNLHEKAGSSNVIHLHGEILKAQSTLNPEHVYELQGETLVVGDFDEHGAQLRPHVVWFGEPVLEMEKARQKVKECDALIIVGTSLNVYPAASLIHLTKPHCLRYIIDPAQISLDHLKNLIYIKAKASEGMRVIVDKLQKIQNVETRF